MRIVVKDSRVGLKAESWAENLFGIKDLFYLSISLSIKKGAQNIGIT